MMKHHEYAAFQGTHPFWMVANSQNTTPRARKVSEHRGKLQSQIKKSRSGFLQHSEKGTRKAAASGPEQSSVARTNRAEGPTEQPQGTPTELCSSAISLNQI